ncbi:MAG: carboxypeptidase-like regulatory domain-containing protein [Acidobacteriales bacterium]|nr:carboxypeptidase-like regulatory domain-containing protein [Terriglobales bacterium]
MKLAKKLVVGSLALFSAGALYGWQYGQPSTPPPLFGGSRGTTAPEKEKKGPQLRTLTGVVLSADDTPVPNAIVYLKNVKTRTIKTYIAGKDGSFQFNGLSPNIDYEVYAELDGKKSSSKTLSSFDSRPKATINLRLDAKSSGEQSKKEEEQAKQTDKK